MSLLDAALNQEDIEDMETTPEVTARPLGPAKKVTRTPRAKKGAKTVKRATARKATKKTVKRKIVGLSATYPDHTDRSVFINSQAGPYLKQETLQAQSANVQLISGATDSSRAFVQSLQAAILQAKA